MFDLKSIYLNSAYMGPMPLNAKAKLEAMSERMLDPAFFAYAEWSQYPERVRAQFAGLMQTSPDHIALSTSVSELVGHIVNGLNLKKGDEIILMQGDFPSLVMAWLVAVERLGIHLRWLDYQEFCDPDTVDRAISAKTKLVAVSHVLFNTGGRVPVNALAQICRAKDVLFLTDVSQSFGAQPVAPGLLDHADIVVGVAYKWLLGPYGSAFGWFSKKALQRIQRTHASWLHSPTSQTSENLLNYSTEALPGARIFDRGQTPSFFIMAALEGALEILLREGLESIRSHNAALVEHFAGSLPAGYRNMTPGATHIVCIRPEDGDAIGVQRRLKEKNIDVSVREGSIRFSFHFFNTAEEVEKVLAAL